MGKKENKLIVEIDPIGKPRMTRADRWKQRDCVNRYWKFKDKLVLAAKKQDFSLCDGLNYFFVLSMPRSWSKKKREAMNLKPHKQKPDLDNLLKSVFDSLLQDDSVISSIKGSRKLWGLKGMIVIGE